MQDFHSLEQKLEANLSWHGARIKFLARFMTALVTTRTVNLVEIATVFAGRAQPLSHAQRCRRFLKDFDLPLAEIARLIVKLLDVKSDWTLVLGRTGSVGGAKSTCWCWRLWSRDCRIQCCGLISTKPEIPTPTSASCCWNYSLNCSGKNESPPC